jgi:hypothetical protein
LVPGADAEGGRVLTRGQDGLRGLEKINLANGILIMPGFIRRREASDLYEAGPVKLAEQADLIFDWS